MGNFPAMYILLEIAEVCELAVISAQAFLCLFSLAMNAESGSKFSFQFDWPWILKQKLNQLNENP